MIKRLLIANRGEIACRIIRSCRRLGVHTIAVYSEADRHAPHARLADEAFFIGGAAPTESYLNIDRLLEVATQSQAEAVHPGYGFLSENAHFVRRCQDAGLIFVGPSAQTMEQMGSKADAKAVMEAASVPTVPGYHEADQSIQRLSNEAESIGYPLMIKAAAGGGGKGMRIVTSADQFESALASAQREARNAFGDDRVILERYVNTPRHIEVQIFGDSHGNVVHLFERDCSSQRRYQKVIEETPSPLLDGQQRQAMVEAAVAAAAAVQYVNAGTIEFIVDGDSGEFFFMEMNTRLQVEHPVTELVTGQDLVEWQLRVAAGESLPLSQDQLRSSGHAFEARIYAEDPNNGFLPSAGTIDWLQQPSNARFDSGVEQGGEVTVHYDPMIAKLIVHAPDRDQALAELTRALAETAVGGLRSNLDFLLTLASSEIFRTGKIHTAYLDQHLDDLLQEQSDLPSRAILAATVAHLMTSEHESLDQQLERSDPYSPWAIADGWRLGHYGRRIVSFDWQGENYQASATGFRGSYAIAINNASFDVNQAELDDKELTMTINGIGERIKLLHHQGTYQVAIAKRLYQLTSTDPFAVELSGDDAKDQLNAPMPGKIVAVNTAVGEAVKAGADLIIMEAMKMELTLSAPRDGIVEILAVKAGEFVEADSLLLGLSAQ